MRTQIQFLDDSHTVLATASVEGRGDLYSGSINAATMPSHIREIFDRYEDIVNSQSFSLLDPIEDQINDLHLVARFGADTFRLKDLQIFPEAGTVFFKTVREPLRVG
jgi:hypothetical protein